MDFIRRSIDNLMCGRENVLRRLTFFIVLIFLTAACGGGDDSIDNGAVSETSTGTPAPQIATSDPRADWAAEVNGEPILMGDVQAQIAFFEAGSGAEAADRDALIETVLINRINQKLVEQAAVQMGITITDEAVQAEIAALEATAAEQGYTLEEFFADQGISQDVYPQRIREFLLTEAVNQQVTANVPTTTTEVHARHILVREQALALDILQQLAAGADFAALAAQYSIDPSTGEAGGNLGWIAPGDLLQPEVEAAIFALPANSRAPEPVQSILGYHIIESIERADNRPLDPARLAAHRQQAWQAWLDQQRATAEIVRYVGPNAQQP